MKTLFYLTALTFAISSCKKEKVEYSTCNAITTVSDITPSSAHINMYGSIHSSEAPTNWGFTYGTNPVPENYDNNRWYGTGGNNITFEDDIENLSPNTTYYVRPFCSFNSVSYVYSEDIVSFTTPVDSFAVGNIGPGGGLIFYSDGQGGGMEMSTVQRTGSWVDLYPDLPGCIEAFGAGENNTQLIVNNTNISYSAPTVCYDLVEGGFNDWFLPSKDELEAIYENLCLPGLYSPASGYYLSSTQSTVNPTNCLLTSLINGYSYQFSKTVIANYVAVRSF